MLVYAQSCLTLCNAVDCSPPCSSVHGVGSSGKNAGVGWHFLLQGIFPTQGSNLSLLHLRHWRVDSLALSHLGSPQEHLQLGKLPVRSTCLQAHGEPVWKERTALDGEDPPSSLCVFFSPCSSQTSMKPEE